MEEAIDTVAVAVEVGRDDGDGEEMQPGKFGQRAVQSPTGRGCNMLPSMRHEAAHATHAVWSRTLAIKWPRAH